MTLTRKFAKIKVWKTIGTRALDMKKRDIHKILAWISQMLTCPICDTYYTSESTKLIENRVENAATESSVIVHSDCKNCRSSVSFNIAMFGPEIFSIGAVSDLTAVDALRFRNYSPLTSDEVISMHDFLKSFDGNFEKALK